MHGIYLSSAGQQNAYFIERQHQYDGIGQVTLQRIHIGIVLRHPYNACCSCVGGIHNVRLNIMYVVALSDRSELEPQRAGRRSYRSKVMHILN